MSAILGIDEVGRGPWAGPLVVGACVLREKIEGLTDSKKLSARRREELTKEIHKKAFCGLGWIPAAEVDTLGLIASLHKASRLAARQVRDSGGKFSEIIIDGTINFLSDTALSPYVQTMPKADLLIEEVSAASIIAKVARDRYMTEVAAKDYPQYGFEKHVGYGTALHKQMIVKHGVCPEHRRSFKPIQAFLGQNYASHDISGSPKARGDAGENAVCAELISRGHNIIDHNWKNKFCEIDIVSKLDNTLYFTEVKYRKNKKNSDGLDAISPKKLQQMRFAAELYLANQANDISAQLLAASVSGDNFAIDEIIEIV